MKTGVNCQKQSNVYFQDDLEAITHLYGKKEVSAKEQDEIDLLPGPTIKEEEEEGDNDVIDAPVTVQPPYDAR